MVGVVGELGGKRRGNGGEMVVGAGKAHKSWGRGCWGLPLVEEGRE